MSSVALRSTRIPEADREKDESRFQYPAFHHVRWRPRPSFTLNQDQPGRGGYPITAPPPWGAGLTRRDERRENLWAIRLLFSSRRATLGRHGL